MKIRNGFIGIASLALIGSAAWAVDAGVKAGAAVYDTTGGSVGTIESVSGDLATISTGANKVSLPVSSFGQGDKGPVLAMTRAQLDSAATSAKAGAKANLTAKLVPGTTIYGPTGEEAGKIESVDAQFATVAVADKKVKLPLNSLAEGEKGVTIGMTADQLKAAANASASAQAATSNAM